LRFTFLIIGEKMKKYLILICATVAVLSNNLYSNDSVCDEYFTITNYDKITGNAVLRHNFPFTFNYNDEEISISAVKVYRNDTVNSYALQFSANNNIFFYRSTEGSYDIIILLRDGSRIFRYVSQYQIEMLDKYINASNRRIRVMESFQPFIRFGLDEFIKPNAYEQFEKLKNTEIETVRIYVGIGFDAHIDLNFTEEQSK